MDKIALSVAGSDPSGGAGLQLDIKVFNDIGIFGMGVVSSLTVQNSQKVYETHKIDGEIVFKQIDVLYKDFKISSAKTGMLLTEEVVFYVAKAFKSNNAKNIVIDPVFVSSSGKKLLEDKAIESLKTHLIPLAKVITPNIHETQILTEIDIQNENDILKAGRKLLDMGCEFVVIKGGHFKKDEYVVDTVMSKNVEMFIKYPKVNVENVHGTGCLLSAAITSYLALGYNTEKSIKLARAYLQYKLEQVKKLGKGSFYFIL